MQHATRAMRRGPSWRALSVAAVAVLAVACSADEAVDTTIAAPSATSTEVTAPASTTTTTAPSTTTTVAVDAPAAVNAALEASGGNYRFVSVVLVGEQTLTSMSGIVDGTAVAADITTGASDLSYVRTAEGEWVTGPDDEWVALEGDPPVTAPLSGMTDLAAVEVESGDGLNGVFTGVLGPAAGSAEGLAVSLTLEGGKVVEIRYQVDTGGEVAQMITTFSDFGAAGSVIKPDGA